LDLTKALDVSVMNANKYLLFQKSFVFVSVLEGCISMPNSSDHTYISFNEPGEIFWLYPKNILT